eukprot:3279779-Pyramimonas_sp.AAC.1
MMKRKRGRRGGGRRAEGGGDGGESASWRKSRTHSTHITLRAKPRRTRDLPCTRMRKNRRPHGGPEL